jgi:hypothetical protein
MIQGMVRNHERGVGNNRCEDGEQEDTENKHRANSSAAGAPRCLADRVLSCVPQAADPRRGTQVQCQTLPELDWSALRHVSCSALSSGAGVASSC